MVTHIRFNKVGNVQHLFCILPLRQDNKIVKSHLVKLESAYGLIILPFCCIGNITITYLRIITFYTVDYNVKTKSGSVNRIVTCLAQNAYNERIQLMNKITSEHRLRLL